MESVKILYSVFVHAAYFTMQYNTIKLI